MATVLFFQLLKKVMPLSAGLHGSWWEICSQTVTLTMIHCSSLAAFKTLSLFFSISIMIHLGRDFFVIIMCGLCWTSWIYIYVFCQIWDLSLIIYSNFFSTFYYCPIGPSDSIHCLIFFSPGCSDWIISIYLFVSSLLLFSVISTLLMRVSIEFLNFWLL